MEINLFGEIVSTEVVDGSDKDVKISGDNADEVLSSHRRMTNKEDLFLFRRMAERSLELWRDQPGGVDTPYKIPQGVARQALCSTAEGMNLVDNFDVEPRRNNFDSQVEFLKALGEYRVGLTKARDMCAGCPLLDQCRTLSVAEMQNKQRVAFSPLNTKPNPHLIFAGMTVADRRAFFDVFHELVVREYGDQYQDPSKVVRAKRSSRKSGKKRPVGVA